MHMGGWDAPKNAAAANVLPGATSPGDTSMARPVRLLYVCNDPANHDTLGKLLPHAVTLITTLPDADVVLIDLDFLPFGTTRADIIRRLTAGVTVPTVARSYHFPDDEVAALRKVGVVMAHTLTAQ